MKTSRSTQYTVQCTGNARSIKLAEGSAHFLLGERQNWSKIWETLHKLN